MIDLDKTEVVELLNKQHYLFVYFYTPLCGTCKVTTTMVTIVSKLLKDVPIYKCNLNTMPDIAQLLKIKSVPCLLILKNGFIIEEIYAFQSVEYLNSVIRNYL